MPSIITTPALRATFARVYNDFNIAKGQVSTDLSSLALKITTTQPVVTFGWLGAFPKMREWVGQRYVHGLSTRSYSVTPKLYEDTIGIKREDFEDGFAQKAIVIRGLAEQASKLPNDLLISLLTGGTTAAAYDGQYFFDTDHPIDPVAGTGSQSNYEASGFALTRANFITARARMRGYKGEDGRPIGLGTQLVLVVPLALEQTAIDIVGIDNIAVAGGVQRNTLLNAARIIVVPELDAVSTTAWYLFDTSGGVPPFLIVEKQAPRMVVKDAPTDDNEFWHREALFGVDAAYGAGYGAWAAAFKGVA